MATGQPFSPQTVERLLDLDPKPIAFIESRPDMDDKDSEDFFDSLLVEIDDLPDHDG